MKKLSITVALFFAIFMVNGQSFLLDSEKSSILINGTSSMHDWESEVESFKVNLSEDFLNLSLKGEDIKSGKGIMDGKTYEALKTDDHPMITFQSRDLHLNETSATANGTISIAGVKKEITITGKLEKSGSVTSIIGSQKLLMTDFGIEPPTAMFGSLTTGDEVTIDFKLYFN